MANRVVRQPLPSEHPRERRAGGEEGRGGGVGGLGRTLPSSGGLWPHGPEDNFSNKKSRGIVATGGRLELVARKPH